jgi:SRSO17 transposase
VVIIDPLRPHLPPPHLDADRLARLTAFALRFRDIVSRADQRDRMEMYLRGLLDGTEPKNAEAIARRWAGSAGPSGTAQSLQHFLSSSPWDIGRFFARYRSHFAEVRGDRRRIWVVQEVIFPKKGRHSVGTQRQLARPIGRKINCQVAVAVSELRPDGFLPLALRLYLPGYWLRESRDRAELLVPTDDRAHLSKCDVAIRLIDDLRAEGRAVSFVTADEGFLSTQDFLEAVARRGMQVLRPGVEDGTLEGESARASALARSSLAEADRGFDWLRGHLGLDQFEGRNWLGWHHHVALVLAAYGFLVSEQRDAGVPASFSPVECEGVAT